MGAGRYMAVQVLFEPPLGKKFLARNCISYRSYVLAWYLVEKLSKNWGRLVQRNTFVFKDGPIKAGLITSSLP